MTDFSSLQTKLNDLKAKIATNSISPVYLGSILDDVIALISSIDMTDYKEDIRSALSTARTALAQAQKALAEKADNTTVQAVIRNVSLLTPVKVESEAEMKRMIEAGECVEGQFYYTEEVD